jgi:hypothetical protein
MTNTGENFRRFVEAIGIKKIELADSIGISKSQLYRQFTLDKVDWLEIGRAHLFLKKRYSYDIKEFFPDIPEGIENGSGIGEYIGSDKDIIARISQEKDIWKERYLAILEKHTQLQDRYINEIQKMMARQETLLERILDKGGQK